MKVLIIGDERMTATIQAQIIMSGYVVGYASEETIAMVLVGKCSFDLVLFVGYERLEEIDLVAERIKNAALVGPSTATLYVFVVWDSVFGYEKGSDYGLKAVDILLEEFSVKQLKQAYDYIRHNSV